MVTVFEATVTGTFDDTGTFTIFKNGALIGSQDFGTGAAPNDVPHIESLIGDSSFAADDPLTGTVSSFDGTDQAEVLNASDPNAADSLAGDDGGGSGDAGRDLAIGGAGADPIDGRAGAGSSLRPSKVLSRTAVAMRTRGGLRPRTAGLTPSLLSCSARTAACAGNS
ncbi:MAG: hypothetical protein ACQEVT_04975 [Pseudomonadota bacterium]|uniref:hypothetical protein n=1 Tax=Roseovarius TaxID=74030 RepID=UPI0022A88728|nr:hypothetical protein [Roseovarius sp. EGI FJ00037]MCZ0813749.1 hypothetical protein [Roseovarius sp. EGI FJ00037]